MRQFSRAAWVRTILRLLLWPLVLYLFFRWFEYKQVFQPARRMDASGADLHRAWEDVELRATDGTRLHGWYFPQAPTEPAGTNALVVLLCHGNAGNISHRLLTCRALLESGVGVLVFDYRGYGRSQGHPSEEGTYRDAEAAYDWLRAKGFNSSQIVVFGESLGGAVAAELALRRPVRGLILLSTFTSIPAVGRELFPWLPVRLLSSIRYDTAAKVSRLDAPLLVMHSRADTIIGYHHSEELFARARRPKTFWEVYGDHNDTLLTGYERFRAGLRQFIHSLNLADSAHSDRPDNGQ